MVKQVGELVVPYPDFRVGDVIDPEQHDINNAYIANKVNELVEAINVAYSTDGATDIGLTPIAPFTGTNVQDFLNELIARLQALTATTSGASLIGTPALTRVLGTSVEAQLASIDAILKGVHVTTSHIADRAITSPKIGIHQIKQDNLDPALLHVVPNALLTEKVLRLEGEMDVVQADLPTRAIATEYTAIIPATGWSNTSPFKVTVNIAGIVETDNPIISPIYDDNVLIAREQKHAYSRVSRAITAEDSIEFVAFDNLPTTAVPIQIKVVK